MTVDANEASVESVNQEPGQPTEQTPAEAANPKRSAPKFPVSRAQADALGRGAIRAGTAVAGYAANAARGGAGAVRKVWRAIEAIPPAVQLLLAAGVLMLLGLVGAISLSGSLGLLCIVVVIPLCSATLGALGYRWYSGNFDGAPHQVTAQPASSELQRSVEYVDRKLTLALSSFGTEQHQQAVIALVQAKTAVELTLGTESDVTGYSDMSLGVDQHIPRPRIRAGAGAALRESNSLAAS